MHKTRWVAEGWRRWRSAPAACLLACGLTGCSALWGGLAMPAPENCVASARPCAEGQVCNPLSEVCEDMLVLSSIAPAHAPTTAMTPITITGGAFAPGMAVTWNGSPLALTFISPTELQATAPKSPDGGWQVTVQASLPSGLKVSRSDLFSYSSQNPSFAVSTPSILDSAPPTAVRTAPLYNPPRADVFLDFATLRLRILSVSADGNTLTDEQGLIIPSNSSGMLVGDLNGDGFTDIMIASGGGFHLLAGITASTFAPYKALHTGVSCGGPMALGDLDHDGIPDLVGVNATLNQLAILGHAGTLFMQVPVPPTVANITGLSIGEFDGQPGDDIAVSYGGMSTEFGVFQGGAAALHYVAMTFPGGCNNAQVQSGHLTGGPVLDLLLSCSDRIQVYKSAGNGTFTLGYPLKLTATQTLVGAPVIADFDGDGTQDVLLLRTDSQVSATNAEAILLRNLSGDGTLQPLDLMVGLPAPGNPVITAAELNGDGKPDVLVVDRASNAKPFHILLNTSI